MVDWHNWRISSASQTELISRGTKSHSYFLTFPYIISPTIFYFLVLPPLVVRRPNRTQPSGGRHYNDTACPLKDDDDDAGKGRPQPGSVKKPFTLNNCPGPCFHRYFVCNCGMGRWIWCTHIFLHFDPVFFSTYSCFFDPSLTVLDTNKAANCIASI